MILLDDRGLSPFSFENEKGNIWLVGSTWLIGV